MNEQELRALVRAAVARQMCGSGDGGLAADERPAPAPARHAPIHLPLLSSHTLYTALVNVGDACVIEPAVKCDHCGFCKSHGY